MMFNVMLMTNMKSYVSMISNKCLDCDIQNYIHN